MKSSGRLMDPTDHADHMLRLALSGRPQLAADHLFIPQVAEEFEEIVYSLLRRSRLAFLSEEGDKEERRRRIYELLIEIILNIYGIERYWALIEDAQEVEEKIVNVLVEFEERERKEGSITVDTVIEDMLVDMEKVMSRDPKGSVSLLAYMAGRVREKLDRDNLVESFLEAIKREIRGNAYYVMSRDGYCRFGNDYAIGLRWLRHLGFVQVSTNPVLAAIAYRDDPSYWEKYREYLRAHIELLENIEREGDELAMVATMLALWPNMEVFRLPFHIFEYMDGMISYQLNPNYASNADVSLRDAYRIYTSSEEYLREYDKELLWGVSLERERGRPNIVFKVAGSSPAAIDITIGLEERGMGTNNTVVYTVSQESRLILAKFEGMARALRCGVKNTRNYETNMGGRLEDHLREVIVSTLIWRALENATDKEDALLELSKAYGKHFKKGEVWEEETGWGYRYRAKTLDEKVTLLSFRSFIRRLTKKEFIEFLLKYDVYERLEDAERDLEELEEAVGLSGTLVAQRVWRIFFSEENRGKWIAWLMRKYALEYWEAERILSSIDVLPASKRKAMDTYLTLAGNNMTNTEFPNHQLNVHKKFMEKDFKLEEYRESIMLSHDRKLIERLYEYEDFIKAYEVTPELIEVFREVGISTEELGDRGLKPEEWGEFGSAVKTMKGFTEAYNRFREMCIEVAKEIRRELH